MAGEKKYYWLKLKEDFFKDKEIKKLRRIAGGDTYTIIYLKLLLAGLRDSGRLYFEGIEDTFAEEIALDLDEDPENVKMTLLYMLKMGLLEEVNEREMFLTRLPECVGSETKQAEIMRRKRARTALSGNNITAMLPDVKNSYTEIEKEKDIDKEIDKEIDKGGKPPRPQKHKYGEYKNVLLTDDELEKLKSEYSDYEERIERLSSYVASTGKSYKSHYATIKNWARKDAEKGGNYGDNRKRAEQDSINRWGKIGIYL